MKGDFFNTVFQFKKWRQWEWQFFLLKACISSYANIQNYLWQQKCSRIQWPCELCIRKWCIGNKVIRDIAASCQPRQNSPWLSWFAHLWANMKPNAQWDGGLICPVIHSHCMILFCIYYFREERRDYWSYWSYEVLDCISSFIPSFIICTTWSFLARQMLHKYLDPDKSLHRCTLAFLMNL